MLSSMLKMSRFLLLPSGRPSAGHGVDPQEFIPTEKEILETILENLVVQEHKKGVQEIL